MMGKPNNHMPCGPTLHSLPAPLGDKDYKMRNKWVDLMVHRGTIACAEIRFKRNKSRSNFKAMCHARIMYEAAVEAIGKSVVAKSIETEDAALWAARLRPKQPPSKT